MLIRIPIKRYFIFIAILMMIFESEVFADEPGTLKWQFEIRGNGAYSSIAIGADHTLYYGTGAGAIFALNPDGTEKWECETDDGIGSITSSPSIGADGTIYIGGDKLYAFSTIGAKKWEFPARLYYGTFPAIGADGTIYASSWGDGILYAVNPDGSEKWSFEIEGDAAQSPAIGFDGTVYVSGGDFPKNYFFAINPNGSLKWKYDTGDALVTSSPAIGADGTIYVGTYGYVYAINSDGTEKWRSGTECWVDSSPVIGSDGTLYVGSCYRLFAINPDGTQRWVFPTVGRIISSPAIGSDRAIYVGTEEDPERKDDNRLYAVNPDGTQRWVYQTGGNIFSSPAIDSYGTVYIISDKVYAIHSGSTGLAITPWPMFGHDVRHTGSVIQSNLPNISVDPKIYDFGSVLIGTSSLPKTFTVSDNSAADLLIGILTITGVDDQVFIKQRDDCSGKIIGTNGTCGIDIVFSPTTVGPINAILNIPSNDPVMPTFGVAISGIGTIVDTNQYTLRITKVGTGNGTVTSSPAAINCGNDCSESFPKSAKPKKVTLKVKPDANSTFLGWGGDCQASGTKTSCKLTMDSDKSVTASFGQPDIAVLPDSYDFGNVTVKQSSNPATFTVHNNGTGSLKITKIKVIGTDAKMFKVKGGSKKTIWPGGDYQIAITFKPTSTGLRSAVLQVVSNDPDTSVLEMPLSGLATENSHPDGSACEGGPYLCYEASGIGSAVIYISDTECVAPIVQADYCNARSLNDLISCLSDFLPEGISADDQKGAREVLLKIENCEDKYW